jgi:hypothetical protein
VLRSSDGYRRALCNIAMACTALLCGASRAASQCRVIDYEEVRVIQYPTLLLVNISFDWHGRTVDELICLAGDIKRRHPSDPTIRGVMFDERQSAEMFLGIAELPDMGPPATVGEALRHKAAAEAPRHAHAVYDLDRAAGIERLALTPLGYGGDAPWDTRILLPNSDHVSCAVTLNARCVLAMSELIYPAGDRQQLVQGTVALRATAAPDGSLRDVATVSAQSRPPTSRNLLIDAARGNLSSWLLERSTAEQQVKVTYRYVVRQEPPQPTEPPFDLRTPSEVIVRGGPLLP